MTSVHELEMVLSTTRTALRPVAGYEGISFGLERSRLGVDCDEVFPNIFVGDYGAATSLAYLQRIGITHQLNCADGEGVGMCKVESQSLQDSGIVYLGIPLIDAPWCDASPYFTLAANFIEHSNHSGGKVLVHCKRGVSRSSTIVISYLMIKKHLPARLALRLCCQRRKVSPNRGFLEQIVDLDNSLQQLAL